MNNSLLDVSIARVSTIPFFVFTQLKTQLEDLANAGAKVTIIASDDELTHKMQLIEGCEFKPIFIARQINFLKDFLAIFRLWKLFRKENYQIIHSTTPKAGFVCAIAAKLAGVPVCIHTFTGQAWVTMTGIKKIVVQWSDKLIGMLNICSYADSESQREFLIKNKIVSANKIKVIGSGSLAGVNTQRFSQDNFSQAEKEELKASLNIGVDTKVLLFIGRMNKDKGIFELIEAMKVLTEKHDLCLLMVGPFEQDNEQEIRDYSEKNGSKRIIFMGFQQKPEQFMAISDILCLPSYREGFGTIVIEAGAMGIPVVGTNIYGLIDAIIEKVTGLLVEPGNSTQLTAALDTLLINESLRAQMGEQAKERVIKYFDSKYFSQLLIEEYERLLGNAKKK